MTIEDSQSALSDCDMYINLRNFDRLRPLKMLSYFFNMFNFVMSKIRLNYT